MCLALFDPPFAPQAAAVAASSSECVDESDTDAAKLLLMMGAPL